MFLFSSSRGEPIIQIPSVPLSSLSLSPSLLISPLSSLLTCSWISAATLNYCKEKQGPSTSPTKSNSPPHTYPFVFFSHVQIEQAIQKVALANVADAAHGDHTDSGLLLQTPEQVDGPLTALEHVATLMLRDLDELDRWSRHQGLRVRRFLVKWNVL